MIARISRSLHRRLLALAVAEPDREVCGLLLGAGARGTSFDSARDERGRGGEAGSHRNGNPVRPEPGEGRDTGTIPRIATIVPAANIAAEPARAFELDPAALFAALRAERGGGPRLLGHYHSHPAGPAMPSPRDAAMAHDAGRLWLIIGEGEVRAWQAVPAGSVHGAFEPVTLLVAADGCETGHTSPQGPARHAPT